jgi:ComF family protein
VGETQALRARVADALDAVLTIVFAPSCAACDQPLEQPTAGPLCRRCWASILPLTPPLCDACGDPLATWRQTASGQRCPRCRRRKRAIALARAIGPYDGALRAVVHAFKYDGRRTLAAKLGALMRERGREALSGVDAVIPVPLHASRRRERGFDQACDLAKHLGLPVVHALRRTRATATQASLPAARRHGNVRGAFEVIEAGRRLQGSRVVLVDDVCTTGATLEVCARVLVDAGVQEVRALTAARVVSAPR